MSEAYERFVNNKLKVKNKQQIPSKFKQHVISFDSEDESQRSDIPHIFLDKQQIEVQRPKIVKERIEKKQKKDLILSNQSSMQELKPKNLINKLPNKLVQTKNKLSSSPSKSHEEQLDEYFKQEQPKVQSQQEQEIAQPEIYVEPHSSLSFVETIQLHLGQFVFRNSYPMKKIIYINNNNEEQNILNKRDYQMRYKNEGKQILYFNNSIEVSKSLFFIILMLRNIFSYFYVYLWVGILVLQFIAQKTFLNGPIQYGTEKIPMIILIIIGILIQLFADILSVYKRRKSWSENKAVYQVYHHNGKMAQWVNTKGNQIQPGHIYKVIPGSPFPTDSIALHSEHSMLHIKENHILSMLAQQPSEMALKSTLIKGINISLPISGYLDYSINTAEYSQFQIVGKLNLQEPKKQNHPINMSNVILRGSINVEQIQILCIALQTGIDSLLLKNLQYPFQHKKVSEQRLSLKSKRISDQMSLQIKQHETKIVGWPSENRIQSAVIYLIIGYLVLVVVGLIIFLITRMIRSNEYFLSASSITFSNVIIYHLTNFTLFIPVLLIPMSKLYILLSGLITQSNISTRSVEIVSQGYNQRIIENLSQQRQRQDILDNKKIIFPVVLKDYNLLPDLCDINTIVTTIDTFRDQSAFTLHSIRVRQDINHNFKTTTLDIYPEPHLDLIKKFMSVAVLSTINTQQISNYHYETGIQVAGKKYLNFQKHKNSKGQIQLNEYKVKYIFHINAIQQYPYKVIFYKPVIDQQLQFDNKRVLVIIRGNPKIILDKVYGKQIKFTEESRRLYQQRGFYVQLICKTEIHQNDANEIERAYKSSQIDHKIFYRNLDKFINKVQPMGLLIFANNFFQKKIIQSEKNPILNKSMNYQKKTQENIGKHDIFTNKNLPNIIILSPPSKSTNEEYLAIYTLTNLLRHPCLFNFTLAEVGDKILHEKPNNIQKMMSQLERQRVLVWNGWDHQQISYTLDIMKKYGSKHLLYLQKDEYMFLMKQSNCAVIGGQKGYDISKYSDITLSSRSSISYLYLTQLISYDSLVLKQGLLNIYLTQISKFIFYFIFEFINLFYTRGTGLSVIKSQFYIVIEIVLFLDIFYYLNIKDSVKVQTVDKKQSFSAYIVARVILTLLQSILIIFISFYSLDTPYDSTGTTTSYQATYFCIIFSFLHILIFQKVFNIIGSSFSFYKGLIILIQILILYLGFIVVSSTDTYYYYGILTDFMKGKTLLLSFCLIWISLTFPALNMALKLIDVPAKVVKKKTSSKFY